MISKRFSALLSALALGGSLAAPPALAQSIVIKTGPQGGVWYPVAAGMAEIFQAQVGLGVTVQAGGGVSNAITVAKNEGQIGFTTSGNAADTYKGAGETAPHPNLRLLGNLYNQYFTLSVPADGPVQSVKDLKGRRLATQRKGSSTEAMTRQVLEVNGLTYEDLANVNFAGNMGDSINQMKDRQADAFSALITHPASYLLEMSSSMEVRLVGLDQATIDGMVKNYSGYSPTVIKAGTYPWLKADVPTVNGPVVLVTNSDVPEELVYKMTKTLFENHEKLANVHQVMREFVPQSAASDPVIPIHPGALRYYREVGAAK